MEVVLVEDDVDVDAAALALANWIGIYCRFVPGGWSIKAAEGRWLAASGGPLATLNGVLDVSAKPDAESIAELAALAAARVEAPWSIQVREEPTAEIEEIAARHHLLGRSKEPFMVRRLIESDAHALLEDEPVVRVIRPAESDLYISGMAAGFEAPREVFEGLCSAPALAAPGVTALVVEHDGEVVATGCAAVMDGQVGIFNISTAPRYRNRGYGRAVTRAALRVGFNAGARTAYLHSTEAGLSLYEALGFKTEEHWTLFTPAAPQG